METIPISKFKATCLSLLERVRKTGQPILITRRGAPVAQVVPPPASSDKPKLLGSMKGTLRILGDIVSPDPEGEDMWTGDWENLKK